ncbi:hypothetical protein FH972_010451 [Carpinus fangiana]|uniref:Uncharacterized protein n=1 Tax=Carpinus fangiana TaxID=176857 RepID=A0A660KR47_9ROSI|nr:hypothetical protein FH972_010451 [Carpinus fangiana]
MNLISATGKRAWVLRRGSGSGEKERKELGGKEGDLLRRTLKRNQPMCPYMICKSNKAQNLEICKYTSREFPLRSQTESADFLHNGFKHA